MALLYMLVIVIAFAAMMLSIKVEATASLRENIQQQIQSKNNDGIKYHWVGQAPNCGGECQDCYDKGESCLVLTGHYVLIPESYLDKAHFGKNCDVGNKALCGPKNLDTGNYWVGTSPHCGGSCDDCTKDGATCLATSRSRGGVPPKYIKDSYKFGRHCESGQKALCRKKQ